MDIKEIAERVSKRIYVEDGLLLSKFISEKFAEALIESYKAELLKEVGEPTCWMTPDGEGWRMRTKPPEIDTKLGWMEFYTSDQVAAAIIKTTKLLEDQLAAAQEEWNQCSGLLDDAHRSIEMLEDQLATAEQRVAEACAAYVLDDLDGFEDGDHIASALRQGQWRKFLKEGE